VNKIRPFLTLSAQFFKFDFPILSRCYQYFWPDIKIILAKIFIYATIDNDARKTNTTNLLSKIAFLIGPFPVGEGVPLFFGRGLGRGPLLVEMR
jgi:hypothetical protein